MAEKSEHALREEKILEFWQKNKIFKQTLDKKADKGNFVFYEGPPTANGRPGIHHLEARAFKDVIPRYKTMQGYHVPRKAGWDTHGLPVELEVEKQLGLKSKKEVEQYGIAEFNQKCRESVWKYMSEWRDFTNRMAFWVDLDDAYITYRASYIESLWQIMKKVEEQGLLYKDYKVVPWCPRCGTGLSSHELAQGYKDVKDLSVTAKFKVLGKNPQTMKKSSASSDHGDPIYLLAWTTTPWTLPGNVGLAVSEKIDYVLAHVEGQEGQFILAKDLADKVLSTQYSVLGTFPGSDLVGLEYEPLYPFIKNAKPEGIEKAYQVYPADFVTTEDGTGIVHTAVMYGQEDFELGSAVGLPKLHTVDETGHFVSGTDFLEGKFVRDEETAVAIIKDLAQRGLLFSKEKYAHSYPHCWRCKTPLIYYARDSWYIRMSELRDKLIKENETIHWEPEHIRDGRFGEWLREVKDWAISRERYWGTPLPVWVNAKGERLVVGSVDELKKYAKKSGNQYWVMRHGEAENNAKRIMSSRAENPHHLTDKGKEQVAAALSKLKLEGIELIVSSNFVRTRETAELVAKGLGLSADQVVYDPRLGEVNHGDFDGRPVEEYYTYYSSTDERFTKNLPHGENFTEIKQRLGATLYEIDSKYQAKKILIITHESPTWLLTTAAAGLDRAASIALLHSADVVNTSDTSRAKSDLGDFILNAEVRPLDFVPLPHNADYELDLHRPFIDEVVLEKDGQEYRRVAEVMDVWFDSGAMPFAQHHYPFEHEADLPYPADYISEAIDQTRGWFYTLHAIGILMGRGKAYKNVICLGHLLDEKGQKMSKSVGNVVDPWVMMEKYGADVLRYWMYSINQPGEAKNFDEKTVQEVVNKVVNLLTNVVKFYQLYADGPERETVGGPKNILDQWILARLNQLITEVTTGLDNYNLIDPARAIRDFIADLSQWYIRRSRDRFKKEGEDKKAALVTTHYVLITLAKLLAPFMPFLAEEIYQQLKSESDPESVHLSQWPEADPVDEQVLAAMSFVRSFASMALMQRAEHGIKIRQPLSKLFVSTLSIKHQGKPLPHWDEVVGILADEINVNEVILDPSMSQDDPPVKLDITITPELQEAGELRDLVRELQEQRKQKGLKPGEPAVLEVPTDKKDLVAKHAAELKVAVSATSFDFI